MTHVGISACWAAGGNVWRYAVGDIPKVRVKLVVNEPTLCRPTEKQMSATERSVLRSSAAARSKRRVSRYECGGSPNARENSRLKWAGERLAAPARSSPASGSEYRASSR